MSGTYTRRDTGTAEPVTHGGSNGLAIAALVCGIVGLVILNFILGPLAIIFGGVGLRRASRGAGRRGMSWAGVVLGIVDIVILVGVYAAVPHHAFTWHAG
jgi:hypothetical protein